MGGNASPFIADLYLSWCEYCYVTKLTKTDYNLAKILSYNCRYLDDICTVNLKDFDTISKDIYDNTLIFEGSTCSYHVSHVLICMPHGISYRYVFVSIICLSNTTYMPIKKNPELHIFLWTCFRVLVSRKAYQIRAQLNTASDNNV